MAIFSNHLISIHPILHQSTLIFFYLSVNLNARLSFSISPSHSILHLSTSTFFYLIVNLNSRLFSSISPLLSHSILHLSISIFFYLLSNRADAYLSLFQILSSLFISHYLALQHKKISPLLRYFIFFFYKGDYILWPIK